MKFIMVQSLRIQHMVCMYCAEHQPSHSPHCSPTKPVVQSTDEDPSGADCEGRQYFKQNSLSVLIGHSTLVSHTRPGLEPNLMNGNLKKACYNASNFMYTGLNNWILCAYTHTMCILCVYTMCILCVYTMHVHIMCVYYVHTMCVYYVYTMCMLCMCILYIECTGKHDCLNRSNPQQSEPSLNWVHIVEFKSCSLYLLYMYI